MKTIETVTATDNTISIADLSRVTGGATSCRDGGCIPQPFPRPSPFPGPRPFPFPFPGPDPVSPLPLGGGDR